MSDFDKVFETDEDIEAALDSYISDIGWEIEENESKPSVLDPARLDQIKVCYEALQYMTKGQNVVVSYKLNKPFNSMGSISLEGDIINFKRPEWFVRIASIASNIEVYPLVNNAIRMTFTFHGLTKRIV